MKGLEVSRYTFGFCAAVAMLAGCGGSQTTIGLPRAVPQTAAIPADRAKVHGGLPASSYEVLHRFHHVHSDGWHPLARLINVNGVMYGTTYSGGSFGKGSIYSITPAGKETLLYSFNGTPDAAFPWAGLIDVNGTLYGTTERGGKSSQLCITGCGTVFSVSTTGREKVLHSFSGGSDGMSPHAALINVNGTLYGTTNEGGNGGSRCSGGCGTVFSITTTGVEKVLYSFRWGSDGAGPDASLIDVKGTLYGTTYVGGGSGCYGGHGCGTVYTISTQGREAVLYSFAGVPDGAQPVAALINVNGTLYGTTQQGGPGYGSSGGGTVYRISTAGVEKVLHSFCQGSDGCAPDTSLNDAKGTLYGTTSSGGSAGNGTIYRISSAGAEKVLYRFAGGLDGSSPEASLANVNGTLYGTTFYGGVGSEGFGTVFSLTP